MYRFNTLASTSAIPALTCVAPRMNICACEPKILQYQLYFRTTLKRISGQCKQLCNILKKEYIHESGSAPTDRSVPPGLPLKLLKINLRCIFHGFMEKQICT